MLKNFILSKLRGPKRPAVYLVKQQPILTVEKKKIKGNNMEGKEKKIENRIGYLVD